MLKAFLFAGASVDNVILKRPSSQERARSYLAETIFHKALSTLSTR
ncbi:hypothetical protein B0I21_102183 [Sphingobacterium paludis]|uniref:Uncharacterized protein n=1 Tax=Sphingobacterium paludis TaxID=1476465 RepID=A0A4R7D9X2_9SPHI|nr:hypothetical protein B0I21_102183 [Sphingobacterium paludis]